MSQAPSVISHDPMPITAPRNRRHDDVQVRDDTQSLMPGGLQMGDRKGKGKEVARRVSAEERGTSVEVATPPGNGISSGSVGPGSARTRVSMS